MIYNIICEDIESNSIELWNTFKNRVINEGDGTYYNNTYYMAFINNQPVAVYINQKKIMHIVILNKSNNQDEYILDTFKGLKYFDNIMALPKEIIDLSSNKKDFFNKNFKTIEIE